MQSPFFSRPFRIEGNACKKKEKRRRIDTRNVFTNFEFHRDEMIYFYLEKSYKSSKRYNRIIKFLDGLSNLSKINDSPGKPRRILVEKFSFYRKLITRNRDLEKSSLGKLIKITE